MPPAPAAESAGRRLHRAGPVRRVARLRSLDRVPDGLQRPAGAQLLHGRPGERAGVALNFLLGLLTSLLLTLSFPRFSFTWLMPVALTPLLLASAREPRPWS